MVQLAEKGIHVGCLGVLFWKRADTGCEVFIHIEFCLVHVGIRPNTLKVIVKNV